jgi:(p)ppGpp synthase/HD superfamily hydrolase
MKTLFEKAENRSTFFRRVHTFVLPYHEGAMLIAKAYQTAKDAHRAQKRKRGERYFEHCRMVATIAIDLIGVRDPEVIAAALLHDIKEDCGWTIEQIEREFGKSAARLVAAVSMPEGEFASREERMQAYHAQLLAGPSEVFLIKFPDRLHNLLTCEALSIDAQWRMIDETEHDYLPIAKERGLLYDELKDAIASRRAALPPRKNEVVAVVEGGAQGIYADGKWHSNYPDAHGWRWSSHE